MVYIKSVLKGIATMLAVALLFFITMTVLMMVNHPKRPAATVVAEVVRTIPFVIGWIPFLVTAGIAFAVGFSSQVSKSKPEFFLVRFKNWFLQPHIAMTFVFGGVICLTVTQIYDRQFHVLESLVEWVGFLIIVHHAWNTKATWSELLRSQQFWGGVMLVAASDFIMKLRG